LKRSPNLSDELSWLISSITLFFITIMLYSASALEKTFLLLVFILPTIISAVFSIYLLIRRLKPK